VTISRPFDIATVQRPLLPVEVGSVFGVDKRTVIRWAIAGKLAGGTRTRGGHWRFSPDGVRELLAAAEAAAP
jgi:predicted site-specific integrase-resolvase